MLCQFATKMEMPEARRQMMIAHGLLVVHLRPSTIRPRPMEQASPHRSADPCFARIHRPAMKFFCSDSARHLLRPLLAVEILSSSATCSLPRTLDSKICAQEQQHNQHSPIIQSFLCFQLALMPGANVFSRRSASSPESCDIEIGQREYKRRRSQLLVPLLSR